MTFGTTKNVRTVREMTFIMTHEKLVIPFRKSQLSVDISEVLFLEASSNYTFIHTVEKPILASKTLAHFHNQLCSETFVRTHQSFSVNADYIDTIDYGSSIIRLFTGMEIPISRSRKKIFKAFMENRKAL